jgi:hypothetical protein
MKLVFALIVVGLSFSCSPNAAQREAAQKAREDSIRSAIEKATRIRIEKIHSLKDLLSQTESDKEGLDNRLTILKAELEVSKDKLTTIKQYQFLRTSSEREDQVRNQILVVDQLEKEINTLLSEVLLREEIIQKTKSDLKEYESTIKN